mmetsp:Transcript_3018/g.8515  ORF Transcript_3018/g.8515 Transcript_3018/m.8515 type:complete len:85 (-) Transcript_3018:200-454(-)
MWGMLYHVEPGKDSSLPTAQLVDVQRFYCQDFAEDPLSCCLWGTTRSENGKVVCIAAGAAKDPPQEPNKYTPTIPTVFWTKKGA